MAYNDTDYDVENHYEGRVPLHLQSKQNRYQSELLRHPDCRDPDHPGCEYCKEEEE